MLANHAAEAALFIARCHVGESVCQVIELASGELFRRHVVLQPQHLGDLHFNGHLPTHISQQIVLGSVDLVRLFDRAMIQPQDNVPIFTIPVAEVRAGHRLRLVGILGEDSQGAGGIKGNASNGCGIDVVLVHGGVDRTADAAPHVASRLFLASIVSAGCSVLDSKRSHHQIAGALWSSAAYAEMLK